MPARRADFAPSLHIGWILAACAAVIVCLCLGSGCRTPEPVLTSLDGQLAAWRLVRAEGRTWPEATWQGRLAGYAAECRTLRAMLDGTVQPGDAIRFKREEVAGVGR